eukprot:TRINITY_DN49593_c0_g1_i2.p1 TRINITY_DN49593_c0_g1~~TRINITY_DN49593_c0_g1_i2.p1  ORF type:complete len:137 (-),score=1.91 TRINITY_DN49593_c0_g1_i2:68-478(-)
MCIRDRHSNACMTLYEVNVRSERGESCTVLVLLVVTSAASLSTRDTGYRDRHGDHRTMSGHDPRVVDRFSHVRIPNKMSNLQHAVDSIAVSYTHLRAHETPEHLVCRLLLEKKKKEKNPMHQSIYTITIKNKHTLN